MNEEPLPGSQRGDKDDRLEYRNLVHILSCLLGSLVTALYISIALLVVSSLAIFYVRFLGGAWIYGICGLGREAGLAIVVGFTALVKLGVIGLAMLCLIVWLWKRNLKAGEGRRGSEPAERSG